LSLSLWPVLAGEPSDVIAWLEEVASSAPPVAAQALDQVYGTGADRLVPFADMLVVHELAHAFYDGVPFVFPRSWLMELFANMALYAFRSRHFGRAARWRARRPVHPMAGQRLASWNELRGEGPTGSAGFRICVQSTPNQTESHSLRAK